MTKFRWHRGGLDESMATVQEVNSFEELQTLIHAHHKEIWPHMEFTTEIKLTYCGPDPRIGWDTWYVQSRIPEADNIVKEWHIVGMTDGALWPNTEFDKHMEQAFTYGMSGMKNGVCIDRKDLVDMVKIPVRRAPYQNPFLITTGNIDWSSRPDATSIAQKKYDEMVQLLESLHNKPLPPEVERQKQFAENAISSRDNAALPSHNMAMIHADIYGEAEKRFRPCQNCHEDFKYKSEDQWLCQPCMGLRKEMERRQGIEGDLLNANKVLK